MQDALLDRLTGKWVLRGTIDDQETVHDINADWVLGHNYVRLFETSRGRDAGGQPDYDATVYIGWDKRAGEYTCLWLDSTSGEGLTAPTIGRAARRRDRIAFLFRSKDGSLFHTVFAYSPRTAAWTLTMDAEVRGEMIPFARAKLTRM
jgi:hypothetical protein